MMPLKHVIYVFTPYVRKCGRIDFSPWPHPRPPLLQVIIVLGIVLSVILYQFAVSAVLYVQLSRLGASSMAGLGSIVASVTGSLVQLVAIMIMGGVSGTGVCVCVCMRAVCDVCVCVLCVMCAYVCMCMYVCACACVYNTIPPHSSKQIYNWLAKVLTTWGEF